MVFKKFYILFLLLIVSLVNVYSAEQQISNCPSTIADNTRYILQDNFLPDVLPCFDLSNSNNVTIDGNGVLLDDLNTRHIRIDLGGSTDIVVENFYIDSSYGLIFVEVNTNNNDIIFRNNSIRFERTYSGGLVGGAGQGYYTMYVARDGGNSSVQIYDNYLELNPYFSLSSNKEAGFFAPSSGSQDTNKLYLEVYNNDFVNLELTGTPSTASWTNIYGLTLYDNTFTSPAIATSEYVFHSSTNFPNGCPVIGSNNFVSKAVTGDEDKDGFDDTGYTRTIDGCTIFSNIQMPSIYKLNTENRFYDKDNTYVLGDDWYSFFSNSRYILGNNLILDGNNFISMENAQNSILDLTKFGSAQALDIENVRTIRLGNSNSMIGGFNPNNGVKTNIVTSGTINVIDSGLYGNNWHLIEYDNNAHIDNFNFDLNAVGDYGFVRKRDSGVDGSDFTFTNNEFDLNYNPSIVDRPFFLIGAFSKIKNNYFQLSSSQNTTLFAGGISSVVSGGHTITDNIFQGGGFIFSDFSDAITGNRFQSSFIHNEFAQSGSLYAYPFHPTDNSQNLLDDPLLNGTYYYQTSCTNYEFNLGNHYEDWDDSGWYNDSNGDNIHDSYLGLDYIERGQDFQGDPIRDYRSVVPYPYDFQSNLGNAQATYDTCQSFNFNIIEPQEQNYSSGHTLVSDWEFVSIAYQNMVCFETLNGFTSIYEDVSSGDNKGLEYDTTDGKGFFQVKCCDSIQCDNIVQESELIEFNIGDGTLGNLIVNGAVTPTIIEGCTDSNATNYNPNATQDDGSCNYDNGGGDNGGGDNGNGSGSVDSSGIGLDGLFTNDLDESQDNILGLFSLLESPLGIMILLGLLLIGFATISLVFAIIGRIIN